MNPFSLSKIPDNLTADEHIQIAKNLLARGIDGIELSNVGGRWGPTWNSSNFDLDFLKYYEGIKALRLNLPTITDLKPLLHLKESLEKLQIGEFDNRKVSLKPIREFKRLMEFSTVRNNKDIEAIGSLHELKELSLTGYSIEKLPFLKQLSGLRRLYIGFGTSKSLENITSLQNLEELDILWVKQLANLDAISKLSNLRKLKIEDEKQIKALPTLTGLKNLKNIRLMNLGGLEDLSGLESSFAEEFILTGPNKDATILQPVINSPGIKRAYTYLYTKREQEKAGHILGNKFCSLDKMQFEMAHLKRITLRYFDYSTGQEIK
jgi:hypothetical protein